MTAPAGLSPASPFHRRLWAYLEERFPLGRQGLLIVSYVSSNSFLAETLTAPTERMHYTLASLAGAVTVLCLFFHLRVFDEHKDYADDCRHYPERILQRGLITLRHLKLLGAAAIALELALCAWRGPAVLCAWAAAFAFSLLMLREFLLGEWLRRRFLLYATSHMLIMPLFALVVYSFATRRYPWQAPGWFWLYAFVGFFVTFNWEISRKIRAPEDEREGVDSYSRIFGPYGAAYLVIAVRVIDTAMVSLVGWHLHLSPLFYIVLIVLFAVSLSGLVAFRRHPSRATAHRLETYAGMYIIAFDLTLAIELVRQHGLAFGG